MPVPPDDDVVPIAPLKAWLDREGRGARAKLSRDLGVTPQVITNWLTRKSLPASRLRGVVKLMGITTDAYLSGLDHAVQVAPNKLEQLKAGEPPAPYVVSASEANRVIAALKREIGHDPGSDWTGLLVALMVDHGLRPSGAREVLQHLATFRQTQSPGRDSAA